MEYVTGCIRSVEVDHKNNANMTAIARLPQAPRSLEIPMDSDHPVPVMMDEKGSLLRCNYRSGSFWELEHRPEKDLRPILLLAPKEWLDQKSNCPNLRSPIK